MTDFTSFVDRLSHAETDADAYNQFEVGDNAYNAIRRANLLHYLDDVAVHKPKIALITEAPGYKGMRLTGVPMLSRRMLVNGLPSLGLFGEARGYQDVPEPGFERIQSEQSGTILWGTLAELGVVPLVWGAFPFHPHDLDKPLTNRMPRRLEVSLGTTFLRQLLDIFAPQKIIAVGNVAHRALADLGLTCPKIRHPAQGGKKEFVNGLRSQIEDYRREP
jgi:uracil-DNA glycosylase